MTAVTERTRILLVCFGNICRSPTAEVVIRRTAARAGLASRIEVDSAGTGEWYVGNPPDYRAIAHAARRGYDLQPLRSRQVSSADFDRFQFVLAMDRSNLAELRAMRPAHFEGELSLFLDFVPDATSREVPDPYDKGPEAFERALDLIEQGSDAFVAYLARNLARR
jgi:protein-tyrosine phosphatase